MDTNKIILGAGRHAVETLYLMEDMGMARQLIGFAKDDARPGDVLLGKPVMAVAALLSQYSHSTVKPEVLAAVGNLEVNKKMVGQFRKAGFSFFRVLNRDVRPERQLYLGEGITIAVGTILTCNISIGDFSIVNIGCTISHDCRIGKHVNISPGCHLAGNVVIEDDVFVGTGVTLLPKVTVGRGCIIAAGACVTKDVPPYTMAAGVPAKQKKRLPDHE